MMELVLASTSPYRRDLLNRLQVPFTTFAPELDETPLPGETAIETATRLAEAKARVAGTHFQNALIIGSDQVATLDGEQIGKPHTHENATLQLRRMRGRQVVFNTALCLFNSKTGCVQNRLVPFTVSFRNLSDAQIEHYLLKEQPYNCAGSAKSEGLGIALIARMEGEDPNSLIGLPLIALIDMLNNEEFTII
ncbi:MAG: Maf family nucleotide pyrophosphatase [Sulfuricella denitrificans]|nr:Maf family nucleotide pyrophosphatase [Sulfuricella denitrificans]